MSKPRKAAATIAPNQAAQQEAKLQSRIAERGAAERGGTVAPVVRSALASPGQPLDPSLRAFMEPRFRHDFSRVRIHVDNFAARTAGAQAFTAGHHIVFDEGRYAPHSRNGRWLIAHELAHVVQQSDAGHAPILRIDDSHEREDAADRSADAVMRGLAVPATARNAFALQRKGADDAKDSKDAKDGAQQSGGLEEVSGQDPDSLLRLDTLTVIEVGGGDWCRGCVLMRSDLAQLTTEINAANPAVRFKAYALNIENEANTAGAAKLRKITGDADHIPQTFVYVEHKLAATYNGYIDGRDYVGEIKDIHRSASSSGVSTGMRIGTGIGAGVGGIAGSIVGGIIGAKTGNAFAGVVLGGLAGGAAGGLVGLGVGAAIGAAANQDIGASQLSEDRKREVKAYLYGTDGKGGVTASRQIIGESDSDNLARDAVDLWVQDSKTWRLEPLDRRVLMLEMMDGFLSRSDQRGILKILENSEDADLLRIFNGVGLTKGDDRRTVVSIEDLRSRFDSSQRAVLEARLERLRQAFPVKPAPQKTQGHFIDRPAVKDRMRAAYEATQKAGDKYIEIAGAFFNLDNSQDLGYYEKTFSGTTSNMHTVVSEAHEKRYKNFEAVAASFHTHPAVKKGDRQAPSASDLFSATNNPDMGEEHYVIDALVVHLITTDGKLTDLGKVEDLLGVKGPGPRKGQTSTTELD